MSEHHHHHHGHHHEGEGGGYPGGGYPGQGGQGDYPGYPGQGGQGGYPGQMGQGGYPSQGGYMGGSTGMGSDRHFYIVSEMNGKVLDVRGENRAEGTEVIMYDKNPAQKMNQLWHVDYSGFIKSDLNNMTFSTKQEGHSLKMQSSENDPRSQWRFQGNQIINSTGEVLDIKGANKDNGADVTSYKYNGQPNQHWRQEFV